MPLTVITLKKVPPSLRGDLTKWMQEIAQGVYVGNFNSKVREQLWERVTQNVAAGEATMSYAYRNEIGYQFETFNTERQVIDYDGIPLVMLMAGDTVEDNRDSDYGFSNASKFRKARKYSTNKIHPNGLFQPAFVIVDIETTGLDSKLDDIIELGAIKVVDGEVNKFQRLVKIDKEIPKNIIELTSLTTEYLDNNGVSLSEAMKDFIEFIEDIDIVGYGIDFDMMFLNESLVRLNQQPLMNKTFDLIRLVKKEKLFLKDYKLQTAIEGYEMSEKQTHRALEDVELIYQLSKRVNNFWKMMNRK